jgi:hypothetical protein
VRTIPETASRSKTRGLINSAMRWSMVALGALLASGLLVPSAARAAGCTPAEADAAARTQLLPYADAHDKGLFDDFGGVEQMGYERGLLKWPRPHR